MVVSLNTTSSTFNVTTTEHHLVAANGIATGGTAVQFSFIDDLQTLTVMGIVTGVSNGVFMGQNDHLHVAAGGVVEARDSSGSQAIGVFGNDSVINIDGQVYSEDLGVLVQVGIDNVDIVIGATGRVTGGSDGAGQGSFFSATLALFGENTTVTNFGTINAELNQSTNERVALTNATFLSSEPDFFDPDDAFDLTFVNGGQILGDMRFQGGADVYRGVSDGYVIGTIDMGKGNDRMTGGSGSDKAFGGEGNDLLSGRGGEDDLRGGTGNDTVRGGADDDTLRGNNGADRMFGGKGDDVIEGGNGGDVINGHRGDDRLLGGGGADALNGNAGNDDLRGSGGRDVLNGGRGDDVLNGGAAGDTFQFTGSFGADRIRNFRDNNAEKIDLSGVGSIRNFNDLRNNHLSEGNGGAFIEDGNGNSILLLGFAAGRLDAGDFIF